MMDMPKIIDCDAVQCAYNKDRQCHTMAITVGGPHPACDTFFQNKTKGGVREMAGGVGAFAAHADCSTFKQR